MAAAISSIEAEDWLTASERSSALWATCWMLAAICSIELEVVSTPTDKDCELPETWAIETAMASMECEVRSTASSWVREAIAICSVPSRIRSASAATACAISRTWPTIRFRLATISWKLRAMRPTSSSLATTIR
ncbi:hypothetical protein D3C86_563000 [compost metagenome]